MPYALETMERQVAAMYEEFFELMHTPFTRDVPAERLYGSRQIEEKLITAMTKEGKFKDAT